MAGTCWYPGYSNTATFPRPYNLPDIHYGGYGGFHRRTPTSCFNHATTSGAFVRNIRINTYNEHGSQGRRFYKGGRGITTLIDKSIEATGDFGWTLDYATAWLYQHLSKSALEVADAIDGCRHFDNDFISPDYAYMFFDTLNTTIFANKLRNVVYLRWRSMPSSLPGVTSAPKVIADVPRICIELNRTPFEDDEAEVDDLLGVMIHQMIHAFFLVCCGAQTSDATPDGRMLDGVHFGVILMTIRDLTRNCIDGMLDLIFHASKRRLVEHNMFSLPQSSLANPLDPPFISIDPRGHGHAEMPHDGQTHCNHDNRHVSRHEIKNWQVREFSKALEADMEAKGDKIWDFADGETFIELDRTAAPPSATYIELVYQDETTSEPKRIMAKREKALRFKSLKEPLTTFLKFELAIPECDLQTFRCIYDFINKDAYLATPADQLAQVPDVVHGKGPPVLLYRGLRFDQLSLGRKDESAITHVKVFRAAEKMKFEELMNRAIKQLYRIPITTEDPIALLRAVYNLDPPSTSPLHSELHRWARRFLARVADPRAPSFPTHPDPLHTILHHHSTLPSTNRASNMRKIMSWYPQQWKELCQQSRAFREDMQLARAMLHSRRARGGLVHGNLQEQRIDRLLLNPAAGVSPLPLGLGAGHNIAGLLGPPRHAIDGEGNGLLDDDFDDMDMLGGSFAEIRLDAVEPMLMASAPRASFLPAMSRPISPGLGGFTVPAFL
ncbi:hypothetical protein Slin15195_G026460 [Septoria linicola]|uniref:SprT-like domain-containing protein n=1 Tax=Septoria linicola TaxID=215465 RepID=A0A9Q9AHJ4_9PEZI|nr:hypothetical protein Slin14017_G025520 [Septoria linicola]USW49327.1 hypothetical protein Slin15195_G026460 [Septoria linicola]